MPEGIPDPESLPTTADLMGEFDHPVAQQWAYNRPFDIRHVTRRCTFQPTARRRPERRLDEDLGPMPDDANRTARRLPTPATTRCWNRSCAATA